VPGVDPVEHRKRPEIIVMMVHDMRVAPRQQPKGAAGANHIHRLPEAVQHEHRLIERGFHTGTRQ
jgi:hypothetical protein